MIDRSKIGGIVKRLRLERQWTQAELARRIGATQPKVSNLERGRHFPRMTRLRKLARVLGVTPDDLVNG